MAVYVNRKLKLLRFTVPALTIGSLWLVGGASPDQRRWSLLGDLMTDSYKTTEFPYPEPRVIIP